VHGRMASAAFDTNDPQQNSMLHRTSNRPSLYDSSLRSLEIDT
jgi:hypothetical protein